MSPFKFNLLRLLLDAFSLLPLPVVHGLGVFLGWFGSILSLKHARLTKINLQSSGIYQDEIEFKQAARQNIGESGKALLETLAIWFRNDKRQLSLVRNFDGWNHIEAGLASGKGIILLTPHLGCFEITSLYFAARYPITVLYRQPRHDWMSPLMAMGRKRGQITLAQANTQGVKQLLQSLKRGEAIGILPDQAPPEGDGQWAPFFGRPAYTMSLASKLAKKTGAQVLMAFGERLSYGRGYNIHVRPIAAGRINTPSLLNSEIERTILQCPTQYLWGYDRYKVRD
ncbi:MAG: lysophospholipid acyltransferase family protein [Methylotenera sp.]|nr:lysophospholipid acyltransferase family protein [Methylotenera sp.]MSP99631.1 lysophospholipid acyltransferase family protein [Methylotenera sp.]